MPPRTDRDLATHDPELQSGEEVEYPFGYFDTQVRFALKWAALSGEPIEQALLTKTALYRRITGKKYPGNQTVWQDALQAISETPDAATVSQVLYAKYLAQPHHVYTEPTYPENDGKHFGFFAFDFYEAKPETGEKARIKVHFINRKRGEQSSLDAKYLAERQSDLRRMFTFIREHYPQAEEVIGGSWLYALQSYRDSFPPAFTKNMLRLVPKGFDHIPNSVPNMSFNGNSVWGQFIDRRGGVRQHVYDQFVANVDRAQSLDDLVEAFPNVPYQPKVPITVFYNWIEKNN